ncbi:MAG: 50S ribosomal protein L4 [Candidatus Omnitrophica bacterium]|nr:50S ribosomal protein L4 [Candidatus Omnitrophota bacterium]
MEVFSLPVYNLDGKEIDTLKLDSTVFDGTINHPSLYQAVCAFLANQRRGLASCKTRGEVSGGGRKPWRQKGTGRARVGSIRSPLWRHGGVIFGPHPRDFSFRLPEKIKRLALKSSLNAKVKENNFLVLDKFVIEKSKTKEAVGIFNRLKINAKTLLLLDKIDENIKRALRNISFLDFNLAYNTHAYEILAHKKIIITKLGLDQLVGRLKK